MTKLIFLIVLFIFATIAPFIPYIKEWNIDWVAWYGAVVALYGIEESYRLRRSEITKSIYITPLINMLPKIDDVIKELTIFEKINSKDSQKLCSDILKLQIDTTHIFSDVCSLLKKVDKHYSTHYRNKIEELLEEKVYPLFSHLMQNAKFQNDKEAIFQKANKSLQNNILDIQNRLVSFITKINNKC